MLLHSTAQLVELQSKLLAAVLQSEALHSKQLKHEAAALPLGEALGPNDTLRIPYDYAYKSALNRVFMNTWSKSTFERVLELLQELLKHEAALDQELALVQL